MQTNKQINSYTHTHTDIYTNAQNSGYFIYLPKSFLSGKAEEKKVLGTPKDIYDLLSLWRM